MNCVQFLRGNKQQQRQQVRQRSGRAFTSSDRALIISIFFTLTMGGKIVGGVVAQRPLYTVFRDSTGQQLLPGATDKLNNTGARGRASNGW